MEMIDIQNMLDALAHSENLSDIPGMQKMKADQSHHDAVHKAPALDPQGEEQFRQWLAARDGEAEDLSVLRSCAQGSGRKAQTSAPPRAFCAACAKFLPQARGPR